MAGSCASDAHTALGNVDEVMLDEALHGHLHRTGTGAYRPGEVVQVGPLLDVNSPEDVRLQIREIRGSHRRAERGVIPFC